MPKTTQSEMTSTSEVVVTGERKLQELTLNSEGLLMRARTLATIDTREQAERAGQFLREVRDRARGVKSFFKESKRNIDELKKKELAREQTFLSPLEQADAIVAAPLLAFTTLEKQRVNEENRRRIAEAEERSRQEKVAAAEALRQAATTADTAGERRALQQQARRVEQSPSLAVAVERVEAFKIEGVATPTRYRGEVTNLELLLRAVLRGAVPMAAIKVDQKLVDAQANALGRDLNWPGVVVVEDTTLSARGFGG